MAAVRPAHRSVVVRCLRRVAVLAVLAAGLAPATPASALGGFCVDVYPQPDTGVTVCTPWG